MSMPEFPLEPLKVACLSCGVTAETWDFQHPDRAVECPCCTLPHDHAGLGCRPVSITATAHLRMFDPAALMEAMYGHEDTPQSLEVTEV